LSALGQDLATLPLDGLPGFLGVLEKLRGAAWARLIDAASNDLGQSGEHDELLDAKEAARRLGTSPDFLYRNAKTLPFTVRVGHRLRFPARGIERYIRLRQGR